MDLYDEIAEMYFLTCDETYNRIRKGIIAEYGERVYLIVSARVSNDRHAKAGR